MSFTDRKDAGRQLAQRLATLKGEDVIVIGVPRGGVVLGAEIAAELEAPLSVVFVRKVSNPEHPEYTIGAVTEHEPTIYNDVAAAQVGAYSLTQMEETTRKMLTKRRQLYFGNRWKRPDMKGKVVVIADDGISTGLTMRAAVQTVQASHPSRIIIAVPAATPQSIEMFTPLVNEIVVLENPNNFILGAGAHYINFEEVTDDEVKKILHSKKSK